MNYDLLNALNSAFSSVAEVFHILKEAIANKQEFSVLIRSGNIEVSETDGWPIRQADGGYEISILVQPLKPLEAISAYLPPPSV